MLLVRKQLILHVGSNKTGSSSIQSFLSLSYLGLVSAGVLYPMTARDALFGTAHHPLQSHLSRNDSASLCKAINQIHDEMEAYSCEVCILSSESFWPGQDGVDLGPLIQSFDDVVIVAYVRDSLSYYTSWWQQNIVQYGATSGFEEYVYSCRGFTTVDALRVLKSYQSDKVDVRIRLFKGGGHASHGWDVLRDFLDLVVQCHGFRPVYRGGLAENVSICGNLLYFRVLLSQSFPLVRHLDMSETLSRLSSINPAAFRGRVCHLNLKPETIHWFVAVNLGVAELAGAYPVMDPVMQPQKSCPSPFTLANDLSEIMSSLENEDNELWELASGLSVFQS